MLLLAAVVWLLPVAFVFTGKHTWITTPAYWITQSAGKYGTLVLIAGAGYCYATRYPFLGEKVFSFFRSVCSLMLFLALFAYVNEHYTKPIAKAVRPSHRYMLTETNHLQLLDSVYRMNKDDRGLFFAALVKENRDRFLTIDEQVLQHWIEEAGYSFPSGHSFNAFLLATVFAFSLYTAGREQFHKYYALPFVWAFMVGLSRVMIGAHTPMDVSVGATLGFFICIAFLYFDTTRKWIIHRKNTPQ
ncbi:MAG: phosphatase PAP2 family protein [Bacteroidota bacterium]